MQAIHLHSKKINYQQYIFGKQNYQQYILKPYQKYIFVKEYYQQCIFVNIGKPRLMRIPLIHFRLVRENIYIPKFY